MNESGDGVTRVRGHSQAQPAVTKYRVLDSCSGCSLVELQPLTGDNIEPLENVCYLPTACFKLIISLYLLYFQESRTR